MCSHTITTNCDISKITSMAVFIFGCTMLFAGRIVVWACEFQQRNIFQNSKKKMFTLLFQVFIDHQGHQDVTVPVDIQPLVVSPRAWT